MVKPKSTESGIKHQTKVCSTKLIFNGIYVDIENNFKFGLFFSTVHLYSKHFYSETKASKICYALKDIFSRTCFNFMTFYH